MCWICFKGIIVDSLLFHRSNCCYSSRWRPCFSRCLGNWEIKNKTVDKLFHKVCIQSVLPSIMFLSEKVNVKTVIDMRKTCKIIVFTSCPITEDWEIVMHGNQPAQLSFLFLAILWWLPHKSGQLGVVLISN